MSVSFYLSVLLFMKHDASHRQMKSIWSLFHEVDLHWITVWEETQMCNGEQPLCFHHSWWNHGSLYFGDDNFFLLFYEETKGKVQYRKLNYTYTCVGILHNKCEIRFSCWAEPSVSISCRHERSCIYPLLKIQLGYNAGQEILLVIHHAW